MLLFVQVILLAMNKIHILLKYVSMSTIEKKRKRKKEIVGLVKRKRERERKTAPKAINIVLGCGGRQYTYHR